MTKNSALLNELKALDPQKMSLAEIEEANKKYGPLFLDIQKEKAAKVKKIMEREKAKSEADSKAKQKKFKYPFTLHIAGRNIETDHIFERGKEYTEEEIRRIMLEHQYYDFSGNVTFEYLEKDNVLLPIFQQHKKG